jgi:hypothetical protein
VSVLTYVYALVRAESRPPLSAAPAPVPGGQAVRLLSAGGLWLAVSTVPAAEYDQAALEAGLRDLDWVGPRAVAHEAVVEHFLACTALLPMKLFTIFKSDQRAVEYVVRTHARIDRILGRIERHVEWGLRLTWHEQAAQQALEQRSEPAGTPSGAAYLARKRDLLDAGRNQWAMARAAAELLYRTMRDEAAESRRHSETEEALPNSRVLLDAAFLVSAEKADAFRALLLAQAQVLGELGIVVSLSGPWPPYNFV